MALGEFIKARQTRYGAYLAIYIIVILLVLGAANYLATQHIFSFDSTANKRYTLSEQTIKIVKDLKNDVNINYFDKTTQFAKAKNLLDRYANISGKLHVNYIDPDKKPDQARMAGIKNYGSIVVENGTKKEEAKSLSEEEISGALIRTIKTVTNTACFTSGAGELSTEGSERGGISLFKAALEKNSFKTQVVSLFEKTEVPSTCTVLIVAGPKRDYLEQAVDGIKKFLEGGGKVLFLIDPAIDFGKGDSNSGSPTLAKMLEGYGVTLNSDLVIDTSGVGQLFGFNEASPLVQKYESHPITSPMNGTISVFPIARSMTVKAPAQKLFEATSNSYATTKLTPPISVDPAKDKKGPFTLGAAGSVGTKGRFVVVGTSSAVANQIFGITRVGNSDLFLNMMNWLTADEELISIRPKDPEDRRITMTRSQMTMLFYTSVIFFPLIIIISGVGVWWRRR
jgi:ABC-type uncharacterized transport system involved in gliding motility auxiliary subunit